MVKINYELLPIKAHYFFFMAAMGPILPQINVFGKQLGISPDVMGFITSILPILYVVAKPGVGYLIDSFPNLRKTVFITIVFIMIVCYGCFCILPVPPTHQVPLNTTYRFGNPVKMCREDVKTMSEFLCTKYRAVKCTTNCTTNEFHGFVSAQESVINNTKEKMDLLLCTINTDHRLIKRSENLTCESTCIIEEDINPTTCIYWTPSFWLFSVLMCVGTIGYNVANCVSDATCFDMLGDKTMKYGTQRVWGTVGFGVTALFAGVATDLFITDTSDAMKTIAPAIIVMFIFGGFDVISIKWLKLPTFSNTDGVSISSKLWSLLQRRSIALFLVFATLAGILDSFIIYYMFWFLEEVAEETGYMGSIKLIEGCVVAAECLGSEILFFFFSGAILKRIGYVHCLSFCFFMYAVRLGLISMITNPWWLVAIEAFMQGPTYALCYTCIVAYASAVAPPGTSATVQGLVAGMDDGLGYALGSLIGGQLFKRLGGSMSFKVLSAGALATCITHIILRPASTDTSSEKTTRDKTEYQIPLEQSDS